VPTHIESTSPQGERYLTFYLADEEYGVEILKVQEIIGMQPITRVPRTPAFMRGVINLRGKVIPIVDLRERFGMPASATDAAAEALRCVVIARIAPRGVAVASDARDARDTVLSVGFVVDRVSEVVAIADVDVADVPSLGAGVRTDYLLGIGKTCRDDGVEGVKLLLDIDRVLATDEAAELTSLASLAA